MKIIKYIEKNLINGIALGGSIDGLLQIGLWFFMCFYFISLGVIMLCSLPFVPIQRLGYGILTIVFSSGMAWFFYKVSIDSWKEWRKVKK